MAVESIALVGAVVGGFLANRRRTELRILTEKLRNVNKELRRQREEDLHVCEADADFEALRSYMAAVEAAQKPESSDHPIKDYGVKDAHLAGVRREFSRALQDGREYLSRGETTEAFALSSRAVALSKELKDVRASRSASKLQASIYRSLDEPRKALKCLKASLECSDELGDHAGDADVLGSIADLYVEVGDFDRAGKFYDLCCEVIRDEEYSENLSPYWDC